jgi:hypothetical protein
MKTFRLPSDHCPTCGKHIDACTSIEHGNSPKEDDVTICYGCAEALVFDAELRVRIMPEDHPARRDDLFVLARYHMQQDVWRRAQ